MRRLPILLLIALAVPWVIACGPFESRVRTLVFPADGIAPPYDFEGVAAALAERSVILRAPTATEAARAMPAASFGPLLERQMATEPRAEIVSVHLAVADVDSARLQLDSVLAFIVEMTSIQTGNCISLYDATTAAPILGACFFAGRTRP
jgi:hypothetical protein